MCRIEIFDVIYPNGARERREQLVNCCARGTPHRPCREAQYVNTYQERPASVAELRAVAAGPRTDTITPRGSERSASRPGSNEKEKGVAGGIATVFKKWKRSSWGKSGKANGTKMAFVRPASRERGPRLPIVDYPLPANPPPRAPSPPRRQQEPVMPQIIPIRPSCERERAQDQTRGRRREQERGTRRRRSPQQIIVHQSSSEEESASPPTHAREHRRVRSLSPKSRYEMEKREMHREEVRRQYEKMAAQKQREAHRKAERHAEIQRLETQDRIEFEERKRIESAERARRRREREDWESEQARRRQELADSQRIAATRARERQLREQEEQDRFERLRRAKIPRRPRNPPVVHYPENMEDRGERYIRDAIREANLRQFERRSPPSAGRRDERYDGQGLRRNNTTGGTHRRGRDPPWNSR